VMLAIARQGRVHMHTWVQYSSNNMKVAISVSSYCLAFIPFLRCATWGVVQACSQAKALQCSSRTLHIDPTDYSCEAKGPPLRTCRSTCHVSCVMYLLHLDLRM